MAAHDFSHLCPVRRTIARCLEHLRNLPEIEWTNGCRRDHAKCLRIGFSVVIEPVDCAARDAQRLAWPHLDLFSINRPGHQSLDAVDRLLVMVMAMRWRRQTLQARNCKLKGRDAAVRVVPGEQEPHGESSETYNFIGRIDAEVRRLLWQE